MENSRWPFGQSAEIHQKLVKIFQFLEIDGLKYVVYREAKSRLTCQGKRAKKQTYKLKLKHDIWMMYYSPAWVPLHYYALIILWLT